MEMKDYSNGVKPNWCPGCGDYSVLRSMQTAAAHLDLKQEETVVVSGIGCSGRLSGYMNTYGFHSVHGRSLPVAQGIKLANQNLTVMAAGGDGDAFAIGMGHTIHAIRRNVDMTYVVMNNQVYGLTKGHTSPVSQKGLKTKSAPNGAMDTPVQPGLLALSAGVSYYAQGFSAEQDELVSLIVEGIKHKGFSLINVFSPCITYNKTNTYEWFRERLATCESFNGYNKEDMVSAMSLLSSTEGLVRGIVYQNHERPTYGENHGLSHQPPLVSNDMTPNLQQFQRWTARFHTGD